MSQSALEPRSPSAPGETARGLVRWLYCNNPFYVISAALVFLGLRASFDPNGKVFEVWVLLVGLGAYTLLLAATAWLLIRIGQVWDDVRTIMLLVVLMFLTVSVIFDETMTCYPQLGKACYLGSLAFAMVVSESLLRGVRLRLPLLFRVPYYLFLALFFLFPVMLSPLLTSPGNPMAVKDPMLPWAIFAFSPLAALITLSLVPAARLGAAYLRNNGSPWRWPLYPWSLFAVLAVGVCARAYYACISFYPVERSGNIFGPYFLMPFLLAVSVVILEIGLTSHRRGAVRLALAAPLLLVGLAGVGHSGDVVYRQFLGSFQNTFNASPLFLTLLAVAGFYAYARLRRVSRAIDGLGVSLAALTVVGPETLGFSSLSAPRPWPLVALAVLQLAITARHKKAGRAVLAAGCVVAAVLVGPASDWPTTMKAALGLHMAVFAAFLIGARFDDSTATLLRGVGAVMLFVMSAAVATEDVVGLLVAPRALFLGYPLITAAVALGYGRLRKSRLHLYNGEAILAVWGLANGWRGYLLLRPRVSGLDAIALGLLFFLVAMLISARKAGVLRRWLAIVVRLLALGETRKLAPEPLWGDCEG
jgi:hypothetical protein